LVDLQEYSFYPERYDNFQLPGWMERSERAWLVVPLLVSQELLGLVLLDKSANPGDLNYEDRDLLKTVGNHIAVHLAQEKSDNLLAQAQQFEAYNRLTAFLMHDLKNLIAQQSLIVENSEKHKDNPEFIDDALATISSGVKRMRKVIEHLRLSSVAQRIERVELSKLIMQVVSECENARPAPRARVGGGPVWVRADRDRLFMALTHAVRNSQDATPDDGSITVDLTKSDGIASIEIVDTGRGMDEEFIRERLFKPFDSTKGTQGVGIGAYQIRETVRSVGGEVAVDSSASVGTKMSIRIPVLS
jgi:putative PEP-CTERM system histidine kinase